MVDRATAVALFELYAGAVAAVGVETDDGPQIGSAFHVGGGVFVTARHVAEAEIMSLQTTHPSARTFRTVLGVERIETLSSPARAATIDEGLFHPNPDTDIALIRTTGLSPPAVPLVDVDSDAGRRVLLEPVLVMGYPRIPHAIDPPALVVTTAEVIAAPSLWSSSPPLILSTTARGGFSGGLVLAGTGTALGVISQALVADDEQTQLGFLAALRAELIVECLNANGIEI